MRLASSGGLSSLQFDVPRDVGMPIDLASFDVLLPDLPVVFCGINPSVEAAATGHNFGSASNRFWRALHLAGLPFV
jgi:hypothetical protein